MRYILSLTRIFQAELSTRPKKRLPRRKTKKESKELQTSANLQPETTKQTEAVHGDTKQVERELS